MFVAYRAGAACSACPMEDLSGHLPASIDVVVERSVGELVEARQDDLRSGPTIGLVAVRVVGGLGHGVVRIHRWRLVRLGRVEGLEQGARL